MYFHIPDCTKCMFKNLYCPDPVYIHEYHTNDDLLHPNPSLHTINLTFTLPKNYPQITLTIMNILGQVVHTSTENQPLEAGSHTRLIDVSHLPNGTYNVIIQANEHLSTLPFVVFKN